ncbi:uncharacterized protein LOC111482876 isoform X2 [Cucurbita maxima]|uniref:Uncharacterized protein LOC111482876 isoform X2 n=1 Tax=Cucurbita maxima TaxID=3661 RepID=A0A6J1J2S7_CUCMA|nr:uncharacterized protein LOC111482876 isoform X2 [Cucurbita maxima]
MALPSNRSSSPSMVTGRTSPISRNSEISNPVYRSFSSNPFSKPSIATSLKSLNPITPANNPSDYPPQRNSVSREILFTSRDNEDKENGKDQSPKLTRVRSPTVGKSMKNFMSSTISAASKIAVSPKKKILGDRNEPVRSSLSFSGMKSSSLNSVNPTPEASMAFESDTNPPMPLISNPKSTKTVRFGGVEVISGSYEDSESAYRYNLNPELVTIAAVTDSKSGIVPIAKSAIAAASSKSSKTVTFGGFEVISDSYDDSESTYRHGHDPNPEAVTVAVEADAEPEIGPISDSDIAAVTPEASKIMRFSDLEAVSNNALESSVNSNFTEEVDCVNLDPSFNISPVSSPMIAPMDADPIITPYDPKTNYLSPRPQFLHYNPNRRINRPDGRFEELFSTSEETDCEDPQKESDEVSSNESQMKEEEKEEEVDVSEQGPTEVKKSSKPLLSRIFKISSLLLILFTACLSICVVNVHDPTIFERSTLLTMGDQSEIFASAKTNFNVLVGKLEIWHANSISFISDVVFNFRGGPPLIHLNQTEFFYGDVNKDEQCLVLSHQNVWEEENNLMNAMEAMKDREGQNKEGQEQEEDAQEEAIKVKEIGIQTVERESQNEEVEEQSFQEIEARTNDSENSEKENDEASEESLQEIIEHIEGEGQNIEGQEQQEEAQDTEAMKEREIGIETVERESQNEEVEEEPFQKTEAKANDQKDREEENDEASEESLLEIVEEESVQEKTVENFKASSSSDFKLHGQIEQAAATGETHYEIEQAAATGETHYEIEQAAATGETHYEIEQAAATEETQEETNTEFQYQSPPVSSPPSEHQSDVEEENGGKIVDLIRTATGISRDFTQNTAAIISAILLGLFLIIPAGLIYARKSGSRRTTSTAAIAEEQQEEPLLKDKKTNQSLVEEEEEEDALDDDDDDMAGEFCSSETSSFFQYSSVREGETEAAKRSSEFQSHSHVRRENSRRESIAEAATRSSEVQSHSHGRRKIRMENSRRESMASSSLDEYSVSSSASPSYGRFTTYEKIPIKHKNGDEEIVTPVRRSSRIRNRHNNS